MKPSLDREGRPRFFWSLFWALVLMAFLSLWQRDRMYRMGYAIQEAQHRKTEQMKLHKKLLIEAERLNALDRIEHVAATGLSMAPALPGERIVISPKTEKKGP